MNERIEELAKGCFEYIEGTLNGNIVEFDYKKFAELIVRECITSITNNTANYQEEGIMAYYQGVQDAAKSIQEHFGVAE